MHQEVVRHGTWQQLECVAAWDGNGSWGHFVACEWQGTDGQRLLVVVNYSPNQSQCYVRLPHDEMRSSAWRLSDQMNDVAYERDGTDLISRGLYLDLPAWRFHVFQLDRIDQPIQCRLSDRKA